MGFSCFRQSSPQRLAAQEEIKLHDDHNQSDCFMMLPCFWTKETKERQLQQRQLKEKQELTLEDWLGASPRLPKLDGASGGEYHVFKHSSKRVFPSFVGENTNSSSSKPREIFSKDRLLNAEEDVESHEDINRSQSGKSKKKVSFRLPEEADIFIFHSSSSSSSGEEEAK